MHHHTPSRRGNVAAMFMVALTLGTLVGLLVLASMQSAKDQPTVGGTGDHSSHHHDGTASHSLSTHAGSHGDAHHDEDGVPTHSKPQVRNTGAATAPHVKGTALQNQNKTRALNAGQVDHTGRSMRDVADTLHNRAHAKAHGPVPPPANGTGRPVAGVRIQGDQLRAGQPFELELTLGGATGSITSYTMELRWNPSQLKVTGVEGVKGGFAAPAQVTMDQPGFASWNASGQQAGQGELSVARVTGTVLPGASGTVRLYSTPRAVNVQPAAGPPARLIGTAKAHRLPLAQ